MNNGAQIMGNGRFQKISMHCTYTMNGFLGILRARGGEGGSLNWNSKCMAGGGGGVSDLGLGITIFTIYASAHTKASLRYVSSFK